MENRRLDLGLVTAVRAEAFGEPGHRTFRLLAEAGEGRLSVWLEKEQIVMLGSAIRELLSRVASAGTPEVLFDDPLPHFSGELDVKAGSLSIGYDPGRGEFVLEAGDFTSPFDIASIRFHGSREQLEVVRDQIDEIVAGSRPRCPLCGTPLGGGAHFCPESNGHAHLPGGE